MLIGTAAHEGDISDDQVTVSIFRAVKNPRLFSSLEKEGRLVVTDVPDIYHVTGFVGLPVQIVITSELKGTEYAACRALTTNASEADVKQVIDSTASSNIDTIKGYYRIMLYLIAAKNTELSTLIKRRVEMNKQPLLDIMKDDIDKIVDENVRQVREESDARLKKEQQETARLKKEKQEADARLKKEQQEADARLKKEQQEADARLKKEQKAADTRLKNTSANYIKSLMDSLGVTIEKAMDLLLIPQSERELYIGLVKDM